MTPTSRSDADYYEALKKCYIRYDEMSNDMLELNNFVQDFGRGAHLQNIPLNKLNRWLGYIQGRLIANRRTTVKKERDWSRPLFESLDFPNIKSV
jgi:hypothetical protein